ncbi:flavin-containing monooxygenase [Sneathiella glossodoripedis]|uniref:flavin-containing monooxygenase n=1 Tax=Sneathiella glossodoripedis TaxID=418853 RepID=UPI0004727048|nr:NAD(P)/FAD-dependent oxidoreductase [Sneathiella glossodoripedis]
MTIATLKHIKDHELKEALKEANYPTLLLTLCQLSGDLAFLEGPHLPSKSLDGLRHMPPEFQSELRERAFELICDIRDGKQELAPLPDPETLQRMLSIYVGEPVGEEYVPMFLEDMGFENTLDKHIKWTAKPDARSLAENHVVIIGAGLSGICAAIHLQKAGIPFTIYEKNDSLGGTWFENTYPACGVDTPNHFYSFSFAPNYDWSAYYSKRNEIHSYIKKVAQEFDIIKHIRFSHSLKTARYNCANKTWDLILTDENGTSQPLTCRYLVSATGQLNQPKIPDFKGTDKFEGPSFHSARWRHDVSLKDKNVLVIGTGASAMQFCPEIAKTVKSLKILQRTPHWIRILPDYHRTVGDGKKWLLRNIPFYQNWYRFRLFWSYGDGIWESLHKDPDWPDAEISLNAENHRHRNLYIENLRSALNNREDLLEKVIPAYPPFAKRMLIDNHWCEMLQKPNVSLHTAGVKAITETGVMDTNDEQHEADVIIYATGFQAGNLLGSFQIFGKKGQALQDCWNDDPRAYLGMVAPDFPNFFMFYGPNTNLAHGGSMIFHIECQARYITSCLIQMMEKGLTEIEVKQEAHDHYNEKVDQEHEQMVWTHSGVTNWYQNSSGRIVSVSPWRLVDYWRMTKTVQCDDYRMA